jgi:hypothetical protein
MHGSVAYVTSYLVLGMGASTYLWTRHADDIETAMTLELDDEDERPFMRMAVTMYFLFAWPVAMYEAFRGR